MTVAKNTIENGKPNRKRILVAPQVPSGPVRLRCIALRATCASAAVMVKGIQSVERASMEKGGKCRKACGQLNAAHRGEISYISVVIRGLDPPARPKPLRRGGGPRIHQSSKDSCEERWIAGSSPAMTALHPF